MTRLLAAVLALAVVLPAAALSTARRFSGRTAADMPISFRLSSDGRRLDRFSLGYFAYCGDEFGFAGANTRAAPVPVARDGTFTVRVDGRLLERIASRAIIRGRISGHRASGTLRVRLIFTGQEDCVTPAVPWSARD
jgi:hypothetical protein